MGMGVWSSASPMKVFSAGAADATSSLVVAYSNSKATMINPMPAANPFTGRLDGVVSAPRKTVASARAGAAASATRTIAVAVVATVRRSDPVYLVNLVDILDVVAVPFVGCVLLIGFM